MGTTRRVGRAGGRAGRIALLAGCAGLLWLAGCGRDADEQTLSDASVKLASLDVGSGTPMPEQFAARTYQEVLSSLQGLSKGEGAFAADASVLVSSAQRGLGIQAADRAAQMHREAMLKLPRIRANLRTWQMHNAAAQAASSYDPAPEFARLEADVRARQDDAERERANKASIEAQIAGLLGQVADRMAEGSNLRDQAGTLRLKVPSVSATEGLELTEQIRTLSRRADTLEFQARDLKDQADRLGLDLRASEVEIQKLTTQIELLGQSRAAVQTRFTTSQEQAARARANAQKAAATIAELVDTGDGALSPFMAGSVQTETDEAVRQLAAAAASPRKAVSTRRSSAQVAIGEAQQSLAEVHWTHALGLDSYAQLMEDLASATPALPAAAEYASRAQAARAASVEAKQAAFDAYQVAKSAYESTGAGGEVADRISKLSVRLNAVSRAVGAGVVDAEAMGALADPEPEVEENFDEPMVVDEPEAAAADPEAELRAAIQAAVDAGDAGDFDRSIGFLYPAGDADAKMIDTLAVLLRAVGGLDTATEQAFGQRFSAWLKDNPDPMLAQLASLSTTASDLDPDDLDIRVQGDEAIALTGNPAAPEVRFLRVDGQWRQVLDTAAQAGDDPAAAAMIEMMQKVLPALAGAYGELTDGVESGDLDSQAAVANALKAKLMSLGQQLVPGGG